LVLVITSSNEAAEINAAEAQIIKYPPNLPSKNSKKND
jgi:hypothetical protein